MGTVKVGLIVSPAIDQLAADELAAELGAALAERYPEVDWELDVLADPLAESPVQLTELVSAARLAIAALASIVAASVTLIAAHGLWERAPDPRVREQVTLFNLATTATVVFGVTALYLSVFVASLLAALVLIEPPLLSHELGRPMNGWDYVSLAWLLSTLGTIGDALGATLETDEAVREAAYARRPASGHRH
jgi:hypothetical protein